MFWSIAIRLVSQTPDNLVYHLFTLLAIAVGFSLTLWQWRRQPQDDFAWRLMIATAALLITRLVLPLSNASNPITLRGLTIPPLERAIDTVIILFLIWALLPPLKALPRLNDALLLLALFITALSYSFANQSWAAQYAADLPYASTVQASIWTAAQIILLIATILLLAAIRPYDWFPRLLTLVPLALASGAHLAHIQPDIINLAATFPDIDQGTIAVWNRLAYFLTFPLLAYTIQRHIIRDLLIGRFGDGTLLTSIPPLFRSATAIIEPNDPTQRMAQAAESATELFNTTFSAVTYLPFSQNEHTQLAIYQPAATQPHKEWTLRLADWPAFQTALTKRELVELLPNGLGARQLYGLQQELSLGETGPILVAPLLNQDGQSNGLLILGAKPSQESWSDHLHQPITAFASYLATALNSTPSTESA